MVVFAIFEDQCAMKSCVVEDYGSYSFLNPWGDEFLGVS